MDGANETMLTNILGSRRVARDNSKNLLRVIKILFFRWFNLLSLDVVFIALAWQEVFARAAVIALRWEERAVLAISIWIVYIADHWLDSKTESGSTTGFFFNKAPRHDFVRSHELLFGSLLVLALLVNAWLLTFLFWHLIIAGILLACATVGYLALNYFFLQRGRWLKGREMMISLIFAIGCALVAMVQAHHPWSLLPWVMMFAVIAFINCTLIARMERKVPILALAPAWTFSPRWILGWCLLMILFSFFSPAIVRALCWSLLGLATMPSMARRFGYEAASLATDQILFFAALLALFR